MTPPSVDVFQGRVRDDYQRYRRDLPWRHTTDPYQILVSEVMLQQTQVERVKEKYGRFISRFPDFGSLAAATIADVLSAWQGLGYNRRALALRQTAARVVEQFGGILPEDEKDLQSLPGIGPYTAAAVLAFAFNQPVLLIDTNIRRVFIHCFFRERSQVTDREILPLVRETLDRENPREWYNALMDFGWYLGTTIKNPNRRSRHYQRQAPFEGSNRQVRGKILHLLVTDGELSREDLCRALDIPASRLETVLGQLEAEGFLTRSHDLVRMKKDEG
ncbi:MAG: A/G-specific adenine glycosylase [Methanoregulaceae archaeon]|nr:A/G-specific adenine glycosylase [Methanoregulaceae archaeon]